MNPHLAATLAAVIWGGTYVVTTIMLPPNPWFIAAVRAVGGALALAGFARAVPDRSWVGRVIVLGTLNAGLFYGLLFIATLRMPGGIVATLQSLGPLLTVLIAWAILGETPTVRRIASIVAGAIGVGMLVLNDTGTLDLPGVLAGTGAAASMALGAVLLNKWGRPVDTAGRPMHILSLSAWQVIVAAVELGIVVVVLDDWPATITLANVAGLAYVTLLATTVALALWFHAVQRAGATTVAPLLMLNPIVAFALDAVFRDYVPTALQTCGAMIVLASLLFYRQGAPRSSAVAARSDPA